MIELLASLKAWHWMLLGIVLLGLETLGTGGFLLGAGVAAFVTCLVALSDVGWQVQLGIFGFLSVFFTIIYFSKLKKQLAKVVATHQASLSNQVIKGKYQELVGKIGRVVTSNAEQTGEVKVGDSVWKVRCKQILDLNDEVRVRSCDGKTLHVNKLV